MTKVQNPIIGRASKQAGGMVFATVFGQNVMRAKPFNITPKSTPARKKNIAKFKAGNELASKIKSCLHVYYPHTPKHCSEYALLVKDCLKALVDNGEDFIVKPSLLILGNGKLPDFGGIYDIQNIVNWALKYTYTSPYYDTLTDEYDKVSLVLQNAETFVPITVNGTIDVVTRTLQFNIPLDYHNTTCFISEPFVIRTKIGDSCKFIYSKSDIPTLLTSN